MRRPLAWAGFSALATLLITLLFLPSATLVPLAVLLVLSAVLLIAFRHRFSKQIGVAALGILCAGLLLFRLEGENQKRNKVLEYNDEQLHLVMGTVLQTGTGLYEGLQSVQLRVTQVDGISCKPFKLLFSNVESGQVGDLLQMTVEMEPFPNSIRLQQYSRGIFLSARQEKAGAETILGSSTDFLSIFSRFRSELGKRFLALGRTVGGTAAAMVTGDSARLDAGVQEQFRLAGVSHLLVVSGLHLSLLAWALQSFFSFWVRRRKVAVLLTMLGVVGYMLLIGFTVSIVRAGTLVLMTLLAQLLNRQADTLNSLGLSLLILLSINPFAACDTGVLLSFGATLGLLCFARLDAVWFHFRKIRFWGALLSSFGTAVFALLFTLPVLATQGTTISLGTVLCNMLCVPLLLPIMLLGALFLVTHLLTGSSHMLLTGRVLYGILRLLEELTSIINRIFQSRIGISGTLAVAVLLASGLVAWVLYHSKVRRWCLLGGVSCLLLAAGTSMLLNQNTVRIALVGTGLNPAVVLSENGQSAVLFRGARSNITAVQLYLEHHNLAEPNWVIDLDASENTQALIQNLGKVDITVQEDVLYTQTVECLPQVQLTLVRQTSGRFCLVQVQGFTVAVASGTVDSTKYQPVQVFLAGQSQVQNLQAELILKNEKNYPWLNTLLETSQPQTEVWEGAEPVLWLRPGKAYRVLGGKSIDR